MTVLLLYRAGLHTEAIMYCNQSHLEHVRRFGDEIYQKCQMVYGGKIPQSEIANFWAQQEGIAPLQYDVCRDALVHLLTGCKFG